MSEATWDLLKSEVRAELRRLDPVERDMIAGTTVDPVVLAAIDEAPPVALKRDGAGLHELVPFVDPEKLAAARAARVQATDPGGCRAAGATGAERVTLRGLIQSLLTAINERVSAPATEPEITS